MKTSIRYLRKQRGLTLEELSRMTGITTAHLSLIERDKRDPSIQTLEKIARALRVDTEVFWWDTAEEGGGREADYDLIRAEERQEYQGVFNDKLVYEYVTKDEPSAAPERQGMEGFIVKIAPGGSTNPFAPTIHKSDEFIYVIRGRMACEIEDEKIEMKEGDCLTIKSNATHRFFNDFEEEVEVLMVRTLHKGT